MFDQNYVNAVCPRPIGWLEYALSQEDFNFLWDCVANKGDNYKEYLIGHITHSFKLEDTNNWFFDNIGLWNNFKSTYTKKEISFVNGHKVQRHKIQRKY